MILSGLILALPVSITALEGRRFDPIPRPVSRPPAEFLSESLPQAGAPPQASRQECENFVLQLVDSYGRDRLDHELDDGFPSRSALLDALQRIQTTAANVELQVESFESVRVSPWRRNAPENKWEARCQVDLQVRLAFDDPSSGGRIVYPPSRMRWHVGISQGE